jgi:hypothetical protein
MLQDLITASEDNQATYDELVARFGDIVDELDPTPANLRCERPGAGRDYHGRPLIIALIFRGEVQTYACEEHAE